MVDMTFKYWFGDKVMVTDPDTGEKRPGVVKGVYVDSESELAAYNVAAEDGGRMMKWVPEPSISKMPKYPFLPGDLLLWCSPGGGSACVIRVTGMTGMTEETPKKFKAVVLWTTNPDSYAEKEATWGYAGHENDFRVLGAPKGYW